jgi:ParB-like chromosome segregation protein Spo0J
MLGATKIEWLSVETLIPYAKNARTHSDEQVAQIAGSIKEFGFNNPVLVDKDNSIIAGHGRLMAARKLGMDKVPVVQLGHMTEAQRKAYVLADNRIALNSGWDAGMLTLELQDLKDDIDLSLLGFDPDELDALLNPIEETEGLTDEDAVPDVPDEPKTKLGDIYI